MRKSFKTALCTILGVCIIAAVLTGCAQAGDQRAMDPNRANNRLNYGLNNGLNNGTLNQGAQRNDLVGGRYGNTGYNGNTGYMGNNGYNSNTGYTGMNQAGGYGNTSNDPSNFIGNNGLNTIRYNNRFGRMGNTGTLTGSNTTNTMNGNDRVRASMIERQLENTNGINDCTVIVSGDTALVGLRANGTNTANMSGLRTSIERRVKQLDSTIRNVRVTDSPDILTRMGRLGTVGNNNGMTNNFMQEFNNMMSSLGNAGR